MGLRVEPVKSSDVMEDYSIFMNISWILRADGKLHQLKIRSEVFTKAEMGRFYDSLLPL